MLICTARPAVVGEALIHGRPDPSHSGLITPTTKLRRPELESRFAGAIWSLYAAHAIRA